MGSCGHPYKTVERLQRGVMNKRELKCEFGIWVAERYSKLPKEIVRYCNFYEDKYYITFLESLLKDIPSEHFGEDQ